MKRFLKASWWEFVQNLPLISGFVISLHLWRQDWWGPAIACMVAGSVAGALLIAVTESRIVEGHREPRRVIVINIITMSVSTLVLVAYLATGWSSWKTDVLVGPWLGIGVAVAQDMAAGQRIGVRHCLALACAAPLVLVGIRLLVVALPVWASISIITLVVTLLIVLIDYGPADLETDSPPAEK